MGILKSIIRHSVGITCELLTLRDPYDVPIETKITGTHTDACGRQVIEVQAGDYREVGKVTDSRTQAGAVTEVHTHVGHNRWEISWQDNDTDFRNYLEMNGIPLTRKGS
jgi:hypothetical protein